jgi:hypothetical protein
MSTNPKKSKAFIITLIAVLVLLIVAYLIFTHSKQTLVTKNAENAGKTFSPLTSGTNATNLNPTQGNGSNTGTGGTSGSNGSANGGLEGGTFGGGTGGTSGTFDGSGIFGAPALKSIPTPTDNPPLSGGIVINGGTVGGDNSDNGGGNGTAGDSSPTVSSLCSDDPLVFTDTEKKELADLLKEYYTISPGLKTADDVSLAASDVTTAENLRDQAINLTTQCYAQKTDPSYAGPQEVKDNPYFKTSGLNASAYLPSFSQFEQLFNIW